MYQVSCFEGLHKNDYFILAICRSHVNFGLFSPEQMHQYAHIHCVSKNLYNQDPGRTPISFGVLDSHMVCKMSFCGVGETQQKSKKKRCFCMVLSSCNIFGCVLASEFCDSFIY